MSRDGSGGYTPPLNSWNPPVNGQQALPQDWKAILDDLAKAIQQSVSADGQTPITGILNHQNNRIANVGAPASSGDVLRWEQLTKGADIASSATINIPIEGNLFVVTGATTISTINDVYPGRTIFLKFAGEVTLKHSSGLKLPSGVDAKTTAGDVLCLINAGSLAWEVVSWPRFESANYPSSAEPTITWPLMTWADTGNMLLKRRNAANAAWVTIGPLLSTAPTLIGVQVFSASGFYTPTTGAKKGLAEVQGAGGGSGGAFGSTGFAESGGAGGGGYAKKFVDLSTLTIPVTVTVGAAGAAGASGGNGGNGGTSSFGALLSATGGEGTSAATNTTGNNVSVGGTGGIGSGGDINIQGGQGGNGRVLSGVQTNANYGGGAMLGGSASAARAGVSYGGGAAGVAASSSNAPGKAGAPGIVIIWEYA